MDSGCWSSKCGNVDGHVGEKCVVVVQEGPTGTLCDLDSPRKRLVCGIVALCRYFDDQYEEPPRDENRKG